MRIQILAKKVGRMTRIDWKNDKSTLVSIEKDQTIRVKKATTSNLVPIRVMYNHYIGNLIK